MNNTKKKHKVIYDTIIIGGGPAGMSAAIYGARSGINLLLFSTIFGGQLNRTKMIENYSGFSSISGYELSQKLLSHVHQFVKKQQIINKTIVSVRKKTNNIFEVIDQQKKIYLSKTILLCTGSRYKMLNVPNEEKYLNKGIGNCVVCEGFFYKNQTVAIIGGGNSAMSGSLYMSDIAKQVFLINKNNVFKGENILLNKIKKKNNIKIFYNAHTKSFSGDQQKLTSLTYISKKKEYILNIDAAFIKIGLIPNISILKNSIKTNNYGEIMVDHSNMQTSIPSLYACGDIIDNKYKQAIISAGEGAKAILDIKQTLNYSKQHE